jgi:hypothetical protein
VIVNKSMLLSAGRVKHKGRRRERDDPGGVRAETGRLLHSEEHLNQRRGPQYLVASKESTTNDAGRQGRQGPLQRLARHKMQ